MKKIIRVGMAYLKVAKNAEILTSLGLGSCVGIALYDKKSKVAGLVHIMLPYSAKIRDNKNPAKFADAGIKELVKQMTKAGANKNNIIAKIAGGAQMFSFANSNNDLLTIGERNVAAVLKTLEELDIKLLGQDIGGNCGRSIDFCSDTGILNIRTIGSSNKQL